jgi:hypothetical protein
LLFGTGVAIEQPLFSRWCDWSKQDFLENVDTTARFGLESVVSVVPF